MLLEKGVYAHRNSIYSLLQVFYDYNFSLFIKNC